MKEKARKLFDDLPGGQGNQNMYNGFKETLNRYFDSGDADDIQFGLEQIDKDQFNIYYGETSDKNRQIINDFGNKNDTVRELIANAKIIYGMAGGGHINQNDKYRMKYMKYKTKYIVETGQSDKIIKNRFFGK